VREFQLAWREFLPGCEDRYVDAVGTIATAPPAKTVFQFNFTGLGTLGTTASIDDVFAATDQLHAHIGEMYAAAIAEEAL
jgi:hypothetical protein